MMVHLVVVEQPYTNCSVSLMTQEQKCQGACCHSSEAEQRLRSRDCLPNVSLVGISNPQSCLRVPGSPAVDDKIATNPVATRTLLRFGTIHSFKHLWAPPGMGFLEWVSGLDHWTPLRGRAVRHGSCFFPGRRFG